MAEQATGYATIYHRMGDEELLNLAKDRQSLSPEARLALDSEMANRGFGQTEISEQAERVRLGQIEDEQRKPIAQSFNSFGTRLYGKRSFRPDGSFVTTLWIAVAWIPLIPLRSVRVIDNGPGGATILPGWSRSYLVLSKSRPDLQQVFNVYGFLLLLPVGGMLLDSIHAGSNVALAALALWACLPWVLRRLGQVKR